MKRRFIFFLYRLALAVSFPIVLLYLAVRAVRRPGYWQTLRERFGRLPATFSKTIPGSVWLHAISVGEVISAAPLIEALRRELPGTPIYVSVGTLAGRALAEKRLASLASGILYAPFDYVWCVRPVLRAIRPALLVVMETEIWPNLWREARRAGARVLVINARISDAALPRYRRFGWFFSAVLAEADTILAQTLQNAERYRSLGFAGDVRYGGNLKYDFRPGAVAPQLEAWLGTLGPTKTWIAASTMPPAGPSDPDEDTAVLDAFEQIAAKEPRLLLILAPRRPERFQSAAEALSRRRIRFTRRSAIESGPPLELPGVLLIDTLGELAGLFRHADAVFMGGTLVQRGGHNLLEPAYFGKPIVSGPNLQNFAEIAADFRMAGALVEIDSAARLAPAVQDLLANESRRNRIGELSAELARARTGATTLTLTEAARLHDLGLPARPLPPWQWPLLLASLTWRAAVTFDRQRRQRTARTLPCPVVSIGGIAMGGSGKTPFAIFVARMLAAAGRQPAFLTRGYGRQSRVPVVVRAGDDVPFALTGDEARILVRSTIGPVGIGADRHSTGLRITAASSASVFVLDDGYQHHALRRDFDIVLIDCIDPFAGGRLFPAGRLREPLAQLARAHAFILTRTQPSRAYAAVNEVLKRIAPQTPIFRARVVPRMWVNAVTGAQSAAGSFRREQVRAFCGLGNPHGFRLTLEEIVPGVEITEFPDHHRYSAAEITRLVTPGTVALLTTEKDVINLPDGWAAKCPVPILWLLVDIELDEPEKFRTLLLDRCS